MHGHPQSRPAHKVLDEAEKLLEKGVKKLLVISQDISADGVDLKCGADFGYRAPITDFARALGYAYTMFILTLT